MGGSGTCQGSSTLCALATNACKSPTCNPGVTAGVPACTNSTPPTTFISAVNGLGGNKTCTQSTDLRCTSAFLQAMFSPFSSVVAAFCNDAYLVVIHYNSPTIFSTTLGGHNLDMMNGVIFPPQGGTGNICNTRQGSFKCSQLNANKFPLNFTLLPTDAQTNNANSAVFGPGSSAGNQSGGWIVLNARSTDTAQVGLPDRGAVGVALNGQVRVTCHRISLPRLLTLTPPPFSAPACVSDVYNLGYHDVEQCNLNPCGEHSGGGGGLPHYHLDGFHSRNICLYGPANYSSTTAHPPLIGFSYDGGWIYGRHLYAGSEGSTVALDNCGGHTHTSSTASVNGIYHYHSAVFNTTGTGINGGGFGPKGTPFTYSTMGPSNCWRGNCSAIPNFQASGQDAYSQFCAGGTQFYFNPNAGASTFNTTWTPSTCPNPPPPPPPSPPSPPPPTMQHNVNTSVSIKNANATQPAGRHLLTAAPSSSTDGLGDSCTGSCAPPGFIYNFPFTVAYYLGLDAQHSSMISISAVQSKQIPQLVPAQYYYVNIYYLLATDNSTQSSQLIAALNALPSNAAFTAALKSHFQGNYTVSVGASTPLVGGTVDRSVTLTSPTSSAAKLRLFSSALLASAAIAMMPLL